MATPARVVRLLCPKCHRGHWTVDNDYRGMHLIGEQELPYRRRRYRCPRCGVISTGFWVLWKGPRAVGRNSWIYELMLKHLVHHGRTGA